MNTFYRHFRQTILQKDYTLCGVVSSKGNLLVGLAICNPQDQFVKKLGREMAYDHAHVQPIAELVIPEGEYAGHIFHEFVNNITPNSTFKSKVHLGDIIYN